MDDSIYLIEYLDAIWLGAGFFTSEEDAWKFAKANAMRSNYDKSYYDVIRVVPGLTNGETPAIPKGGVSMYRIRSGAKQS